MKINLSKAVTLPFLCLSMILYSQNDLQVETLLDLNASGGVTFGPDGNVYVSDFGPALGQPNFNTKVYKLEYGTWEVSEFASGFSGASGACFDSQGNFYQSNPSGGRVSKVSPDGTIDLNWVNTGLASPIGIIADPDDNLFVCNCGSNSIRKITPQGLSLSFASSDLFNCPNGLTMDPDGNLYACNFSDDKVLKITADGVVSEFASLPNINGGVGNGHLTYSNGFIFVTTIGGGEVYKISLDGEKEKIAGVFAGFSNNDGPALQATFSKPNGIAASTTGDTLFINCSYPTWPSSNLGLHPALVRMVTGVCSLPDVDCPLLTSTLDSPQEDRLLPQLLPNTPNPFKGKTNINYQIPSDQQVTIQVLDVNGRAIFKHSAWTAKGQHSLPVDTTRWLPGMYLLQLKGESFSLEQKMMKTK